VLNLKIISTSGSLLGSGLGCSLGAYLGSGFSFFSTLYSLSGLGSSLGSSLLDSYFYSGASCPRAAATSPAYLLETFLLKGVESIPLTALSYTA